MLDNNELMHFGILGMKWGRRKDKNRSSKTAKQKQKEKNIKQQVKEVKKSRKKAMDRIVLMSDKELDDRIKRLSKEKTLKQLTEEQTSPGQKFVKKQLSNLGNKSINAITSFGIEVGRYNAKKHLGMN